MGRIYFDPPATEATTFAADGDSGVKEALTKVAQIIPAEILGAYGSALGTVPLWSTTAQPYVAGCCFLLGFLGTGWYVGWAIGQGIRKQKHILVYMVAFAVWAYALTGATALAPIYHPGVAALAPILASVALAKISLPKREVK
jgi:hypothetical protein